MDTIVGIMLGAAIVFGAIVLAVRHPTKPLKRRNNTDHGGWNDTNGSSTYIP